MQRRQENDNLFTRVLISVKLISEAIQDLIQLKFDPETFHKKKFGKTNRTITVIQKLYLFQIQS